MNLYAYCLSDEITPHSFDPVVGVAGAKPHLIEHEGIAVVVSEFDGESVALSRENIFAHERVIDHVLAQTTPLPFRFGTVTSQTRLESYIHSEKGPLLEMLARVCGCEEMSLKVIWDGEAMKRLESVEDTGTQNEDTAAVEATGPGTAFLAAKQREIMGDEILKQRAGEVAAWLAERLGGVAQESVVRVCPTEALVVAAAYLIKRARLEEYKERLNHVREERGDLRFMASGPWPPYTFSNLPS